MNITAGRGSAASNRYGMRNTDGNSGVRLSIAGEVAEKRAAARAKAKAEQKAREQKRAQAAKKAREAQRKQENKKKLNYNFKQISARILQAKTSVSARKAMNGARRKVVELRRKVKMSVADGEGLLNAIRHAEAMVRIAKKKMRHLEEEENVKLRGGVCEAALEEEMEDFSEEEFCEDVELEPEFDMEDLQELMELYQELMEEALEDMEALSELEDMMLGGVGVEMDPEDLEQMKRKHRSEELRKLVEADMEYLRALFDKLAKEQQSGLSGIGDSHDSAARSYGGCDTGGVSLELGGVDIPVETQAVSAAELVEGGFVDASV